jgi:hypothetical protein
MGCAGGMKRFCERLVESIRKAGNPCVVGLARGST